MYEKHTIEDALRFLNTTQNVRVPAFQVLGRIEDAHPADQIMGVAIALVAMTEAVGLPVGDVLTRAQNMMADAEGPFTIHVQAIRRYAENELRRK